MGSQCVQLKMHTPREFLNVIGVHRKYLMEAPGLHKNISCQKALCNRCPMYSPPFFDYVINSEKLL